LDRSLNELRELERYLEDEVEHDTKLVIEHCADGPTLIHREKRTPADFVELQSRLVEVRRQILEITLSDLARLECAACNE
jgi:hypothetical protein